MFIDNGKKKFDLELSCMNFIFMSVRSKMFCAGAWAGIDKLIKNKLDLLVITSFQLWTNF